MSKCKPKHRPRRYPHPERMVGNGRMRQFAAYLKKVIRLPQLAENTLHDSRRSPKYSTTVCVLLPILMLVMRIRSFNLFESRLDDKPMKKLFGGQPIPKCVDTIANTLKKIDLDSLRTLHEEILKVAKKNKVFRNTFHQGLKMFCFDGFESIRSQKRSCKGCLSATYETDDGEVTDHFHRFVVMYSIGFIPDLILGLEPQKSLTQLKCKNSEAQKAQGELTAVKPLIDRLRNLFPKLFDVGIGDALYSNGPMINFMKNPNPAYDLIAILKKENNEPMADAIKLYDKTTPTKIYYDRKRGEHVRMWDTEGFEALESSHYPLRVIKAQVHKGPKSLKPQDIDWDGENIGVWWIVTTIPQKKLSGPNLLDAQRKRWNGENVQAQLTLHWYVKHSYVHHDVATTAMMYIFMIAFNLFQLFLYRCLRNFENNFSSSLEVVEQMKLDYAHINDSKDGLFPDIVFG